jgi:hypothetical protein
MIAASFALRTEWKDARQDASLTGGSFFVIRSIDEICSQRVGKTLPRRLSLIPIIDFVYQIIEFRWFHPEEAVMVATILPLLPYSAA